jgi:ubiquinone/menaquinone biosynthesis C-methylase UbiE/uncharacterized C2H2 Zn-finger protein
VGGVNVIWLWALLALALLLLVFLFYWAFIITEGAYLGARVVAWTYDITARRYERIKQFNPLHDAWLLAVPMLHALDGVHGPLVLDVATGTGRLPRTLLNRPLFQGYVVGLDLSSRMLREADASLRPYRDRYTLVWHNAQDLPFPDETFDAVACLEALEFMPSPQRVLGEMARVLRPGGVFLVTNRINWESKLMPGKAFTDDQMRAMLRDAGLVQVEIRPWQVYYDLIWARKVGAPSRLGRGTRDRTEILRCPRCHNLPLEETAHELRCPACQAVYPLTGDICAMNV